MTVRVCDLPVDQIRVGLQFLGFVRGALCTVVPYRHGTHGTHGGHDEILNGVVNRHDDWFCFQQEGDDWWGHGVYHHMCRNPVVLDSLRDVLLRMETGP